MASRGNYFQWKNYIADIPEDVWATPRATARLEKLKSWLRENSGADGEKINAITESSMENAFKTHVDEKSRQRIIARRQKKSNRKRVNIKSLTFSTTVEIILLLEKGLLVGKDASDVVGAMTEPLQGLSTDAIINVAKEIIDGVEEYSDHDGLVFELLGRCFSRLGNDSMLRYEDEMKPCRYVRSVLFGRLMSSNWSANYAINLVSVLRDAGLDPTEQQSLCTKGLALLNTLDLSALPSLAYQLLLLATAEKGSVVLKLADFFEVREAQFRAKLAQKQQQLQQQQLLDALQQTEGTILLHVDVVLKQDASLAKDVIKALNAHPFSNTPFVFGFLLASLRSSRHQEEVAKLLISLVTTGIADDATGAANDWAQEALKGGRRRMGNSIKLIWKDTINRAGAGWHIIIPALVQLGFNCMEARMKQHADQIRELGSNMLQLTFQQHSSSRADILSHLLTRIATVAAEAPYFIDLLAALVQKHTQQVLEYVQKIQESLDYLSYLRPAVGLKLVEAVLPLLDRSKPFQDHLMIVLRKAMFRGDVQSRMTAVGSFARWCAQSRMEETLAADVMGFLARALTQQKDVRSVVYSHLETILLLQADGRIVLEILNDQLARYFPPGAKQVNISLCVEGDVVLEPIGQLLVTARRCALIGLQQNPRVSKRAEPLLARVTALVEFVLSAELEDFELDKHAELNPDDPIGRRNAACATVVSDLYVACIELNALSNPSKSTIITESGVRSCLALFRRYEQLQATVREGENSANAAGAKKRKKASASSKAGGGADGADAVGGAAGGGSASSASSSSSSSVSSFPPCSLSLEAVLAFSDLLTMKNPETQIVRDAKSFHQWIVMELCRVVHRTIVGDAFGAALTVENKREVFLKLAFGMMEEYKKESEDMNRLLAESLHEVLQFLSTSAHTPEEATEQMALFLNAANRTERTREATAEQALLIHLETIMSFVGPLILGKKNKELLQMFYICDLLIKSIRTESLENLARAATGLLKESLDNVVVAGALITLFLDVCEKNKGVTDGALALVQELQAKLGKEGILPVAGDGKLAIVSDKTWPVVMSLILGVCERALTEGDYAIGVLKGNEITKDYDLEKLRGVLYERWSQAVSVLTQLAMTNLEWCASSESLLKVCTRFLKALHKLTKLFHTQKHVPSAGFVSLIKGCGGLISGLYELLDRLGHNDGDKEDPDDAAADNDGDNNKKKKKATATKKQRMAAARARREEKVQPALVYEIERLEALLLKYQEQAHVALMTSWRRSTERDFKINRDKLVAFFEKKQQQQQQQQQQEEAQAPLAEPEVQVVEDDVPQKSNRGRKKADTASSVSVSSSVSSIVRGGGAGSAKRPRPVAGDEEEQPAEGNDLKHGAKVKARFSKKKQERLQDRAEKLSKAMPKNND